MLRRHFNSLALFLILCLLLTVGSPLAVWANEATEPMGLLQAEEISGTHLVAESSVFQNIHRLFDADARKCYYSGENSCLTLEYEQGIGSLYLCCTTLPDEFTITDNASGTTLPVAEDILYHHFVDLTALFGSVPTSITIHFGARSFRYTELRVFTPGQVPEDVQIWTAPEEGKTDLVLFSTHSDDDQLFFAGILPYYAVERGYQVQVVYLTNHFNTANVRVHEMLNGLWACGVHTYPVFGPYEDFGDTHSLEGALKKFESLGWSREQMTGFVVEQLRRFKPLVAVGHDFNGEYGHAQHRVYAQLLADAVAVSADSAAYPGLAEKYGTWDVPKTYIHLYSENQIVMDWDQPMHKFNGMTPYEVTRDLGFQAHVSQQKGWSWYFSGKETAAEIERYSPCIYGLYRSTVGMDIEKNDFFENLTSYGERAKLEEAARLESERLKAEEEAKKAAEEEAKKAADEEARKASEEAARRKAREEDAARQEAARLKAEAEDREKQAAQTRFILICCGTCAVLTLLAFFIIIFISSKKSGRYSKHGKKKRKNF